MKSTNEFYDFINQIEFDAEVAICEARERNKYIGKKYNFFNKVSSYDYIVLTEHMIKAEISIIHKLNSKKKAFKRHQNELIYLIGSLKFLCGATNNELSLYLNCNDSLVELKIHKMIKKIISKIGKYKKANQSNYLADLLFHVSCYSFTY